MLWLTTGHLTALYLFLIDRGYTVRICRLFVRPQAVDLSAQSVLITEPEQIHQLLRVLRLNSGARIDILDGLGNILHCRLEESFDHKKSDRQVNRRASKQVRLAILSREAAPGEPAVRLLVALPVLRPSRFEWALEKLTEIGASSIMALDLERSRRQEKATNQKSNAPDASPRISARLSRWRNIVREAAEQCERAMIPDVVDSLSLRELMRMPDLSGEHCLKVVAAERAQVQGIRQLLDEFRPRQRESLSGRCDIEHGSLCNTVQLTTVCLLIGAEGGFTESEIGISLAHGFRAVSLGRRILRAETAALYAASVIMSALDE